MAQISPTYGQGPITQATFQVSAAEFQAFLGILKKYEATDPEVASLVQNTINPALAAAGLPTI